LWTSFKGTAKRELGAGRAQKDGEKNKPALQNYGQSVVCGGRLLTGAKSAKKKRVQRGDRGVKRSHRHVVFAVRKKAGVPEG